MRNDLIKLRKLVQEVTETDLELSSNLTGLNKAVEDMHRDLLDRHNSEIWQDVEAIFEAHHCIFSLLNQKLQAIYEDIEKAVEEMGFALQHLEDSLPGED